MEPWQRGQGSNAISSLPLMLLTEIIYFYVVAFNTKCFEVYDVKIDKRKTYGSYKVQTQNIICSSGKLSFFPLSSYLF